jgi:hypothetical protein
MASMDSRAVTLIEADVKGELVKETGAGADVRVWRAVAGLEDKMRRGGRRPSRPLWWLHLPLLERRLVVIC